MGPCWCRYRLTEGPAKRFSAYLRHSEIRMMGPVLLALAARKQRLRLLQLPDAEAVTSSAAILSARFWILTTMPTCGVCNCLCLPACLPTFLPSSTALPVSPLPACLLASQPPCQPSHDFPCAKGNFYYCRHLHLHSGDISLRVRKLSEHVFKRRVLPSPLEVVTSPEEMC